MSKAEEVLKYIYKEIGTYGRINAQTHEKTMDLYSMVKDALKELECRSVHQKIQKKYDNTPIYMPGEREGVYDE